nr:hypothetical protein [uncultured Methanospirillum sp.]
MSTTHVRIPVEIKNKLDSLANEGESIGALISRLIDFYENSGHVNTPVNSNVNESESCVNTSLTEDLRALEDRVAALEAERSPAPITLCDSPLKDAILIESASISPDIVTPAHEKEDRVSLTEEMQSLVTERLKAMRVSGMSYKTIQEKTSIPEGSQKKAISPNQSLKSLTRHQYETLMSF